jgi:exonuclease VII large subunit
MTPDNGRKRAIIPLTAVLLMALHAAPVSAVEVAPRISDREIIESLAELKAGQKALEARMDQRFDAFQRQIDERFGAVDQRFDAFQRRIEESFEAVHQRFDAFQQQIDQRFEAVDQRFEAVDQRFEAVDQRFTSIDQQLDQIWNLMLVIIAGIFGLIGYIVWDRKTALRPVEQRLMALEAEFHRDLEIQHEDGSRLTRLVKVLREMAKSDEKLAEVLRSFSLL